MGIFDTYKKKRAKNLANNKKWLEQRNKDKASGKKREHKRTQQASKAYRKGRKIAIDLGVKADKVQKSEVWGFTGVEDIMKKKQSTNTKVQAKRKPTRQPKIGIAKPIDLNSDAVVILGKKDPYVKKFSVKYKSKSASKYNRKWFESETDARAFAQGMAAQLNAQIINM